MKSGSEQLSTQPSQLLLSLEKCKSICSLAHSPSRTRHRSRRNVPKLRRTRPDQQVQLARIKAKMNTPPRSFSLQIDTHKVKKRKVQAISLAPQPARQDISLDYRPMALLQEYQDQQPRGQMPRLLEYVERMGRQLQPKKKPTLQYDEDGVYEYSRFGWENKFSKISDRVVEQKKNRIYLNRREVQPLEEELIQPDLLVKRDSILKGAGSLGKCYMQRLRSRLERVVGQIQQARNISKQMK